MGRDASLGTTRKWQNAALLRRSSRPRSLGVAQAVTRAVRTT